MTDEPTNLTIKFEVPIFEKYIIPHGYLSIERPCHALWRYYLAARNAYEDIELDQITLEGNPDQTVNYQQLFTSIALSYSVQPEHMVSYWINVDMQCDLLDIPRMPTADKFRFNKVPEIKTQ